MVWKEDGTLEEKRGGIVHDGSEVSICMYALSFRGMNALAIAVVHAVCTNAVCAL